MSEQTAPLYHERYRPQFHFTAQKGWINDPVGLHAYRGVYHLFFQHNPDDTQWNNMHWGHAVSTDLVHWVDEGDVLFPDETGDMWSGSAVVDWLNTTGLQTGADAPQVLLYTAAGSYGALSKGQPFTQCMAYSVDGGRTWVKYDRNPVIGYIAGATRDPKVCWYEPGKHWVMALYIDGEQFALFSSPDLKSWTRLCEVVMPGCGECPDFFPLPVDGDPHHMRWVFSAATQGAYRIGHFDGKRFQPESEVLFTVPAGACSYAAQTYHLPPGADARRIQMTWGRLEVPGMPFNGYLTFPCELTLRTTRQGPRLFMYPIAEISGLYRKRYPFAHLHPNDEIITLEAPADLLDIHAEWSTGSADVLGFIINGMVIEYHTAKKQLVCGNVSCAVETEADHITFRLLVDTISLEVFVNEGAAYMPLGSLTLAENERQLAIFARGGQAELVKMDVYELAGIHDPA